jgi:hypothetical protein
MGRSYAGFDREKARVQRSKEHLALLQSMKDNRWQNIVTFDEYCLDLVVDRE